MVREPFEPNRPKVTVIGGGTGSFMLLSALKNFNLQLAAIVNMVDDGGSTGVLRDELGVLPPGDVRQCLVALSESPEIRDLFNYRFEDGTFAGHAFGNLLLTALEKSTGSFAQAVETASDILRIEGMVVPATLDNVRLKMEWENDNFVLNGENTINSIKFPHDPRRAKLSLEPEAQVNPTAEAAIEQADMVIIAPGGLYTSLGPLLVIDGIGKALQRTKAKVVYVCNLVTKSNQTENLSVADHAAEIERFIGAPRLDAVLYNSQKPSSRLLERYRSENAHLVEYDVDELEKQAYNAVGGDFLGKIAKYNPHNEKLPVTRSLIRHNPQSVVAALIELLNIPT